MDPISIYKINLGNVFNEMRQEQRILNENSEPEKRFLALGEIAKGDKKLQKIFCRAKEKYNLMLKENYYLKTSNQ